MPPDDNDKEQRKVHGGESLRRLLERLQTPCGSNPSRTYMAEVRVMLAGIASDPFGSCTGAGQMYPAYVW